VFTFKAKVVAEGLKVVTEEEKVIAEESKVVTEENRVITFTIAGDDFAVSYLHLKGNQFIERDKLK
jgi:mannose-6-phosphate isomerase class I